MHTIVEPTFTERDGKEYLSDRHDQPVVFTTRFSAFTKEQQLKRAGHNVSLEPTPLGSFYKIVKLS